MSEVKEKYAGSYTKIPVDDIILGERSRENYGDIEDLALTIQDKGLLHPPIIDSNNKLIAGGRRLKAVKFLGWKTIPVIKRDITTELDLREIELLENIMRKDLDWTERPKLVKRIDDLMREKNEDWQRKDTAKLVGRSIGGINDNIILAAALEHMPELANAKNEDDAVKKLREVQERLALTELRRREVIKEEKIIQEDRIAGITPAQKIKRNIESLSDRYIIGDVFKNLEKIPKDNQKIKFIECDPPYAIDFSKQKRRSSYTSDIKSYKEIPQEEYVEFLDKLTHELYRVLSPRGTVVFWFGMQWYSDVLRSLKNAGFFVDLIPAIWTKKHGQTNIVRHQLARTYEMFFYGRKDKEASGVIKLGRSNNFEFKGVYSGDKYHPTQRPIDLIKEIINTFGAFLPKDESQILVPFLGSGATILAAEEMGYHAFGFDSDPQYKDSFLHEVRKKEAKKYLMD